ncbi:MAG: hypothetical protein JWO98_4180 [Frankiales bacterium]|nr:hypothetical protein [Frankiales bacterium]
MDADQRESTPVWGTRASATFDPPRDLDGRAGAGSRRSHVHWFRWGGEDPFGPHNLYRCRCGMVRHGL